MKPIDTKQLAAVTGGVRMGPNGETCTDPRPTFPRPHPFPRPRPGGLPGADMQ